MDWLGFHFLVILFGCYHIHCTKLNFPRILLPVFDELRINFTLEVVEQGCYTWTSSRVDLVQITPVYEPGTKCTYKAVVTAFTKEKQRNTAIVLAEDHSTKEVLRCDVILDVIHKLGVLTTTRELYLEEAPETFELWAQDSKGNAFTTLEGIAFNWEISSQNYRSIDTIETSTSTPGDPSWKQVLRFLTFGQSKYHDVPKSVEKFEHLGLRGYMVLLEGINTGSASVKVKLPHVEYRHVTEVTVDIIVVANLLLDPLDVHMLVGDQITFKVLQLKQGRLQEISLSNQYYLETENKETAIINGKIITGISVGITFVALKDRNLPAYKLSNNESKPPLPKASITVVIPYKLSLSLLPHYNWVTVNGESHIIVLDIYSKNDKKITLGPTYKLECSFDKRLFNEINGNINRSRIEGVAIKKGVTLVKGALDRFELQAESELHIYDKLELTPKQLIVPYDPNSSRSQQIQFEATGGDGSYIWSSNNAQLITISQTGMVVTHMGTLNLTSELTKDKINVLQELATVTVALSRNTNIQKNADIYFLPPEKLKIVRYNFETAVGDYIVIHLALYANVNGSLIPYTSCENVNFDLVFGNNHILSVDLKKPTTQVKDACRQIFLKANAVGTTSLKVSHRLLHKELSDKVVLVAFRPLDILNPATNEIVLPIGSSRNVFFHHGPQRVYNIEVELIKTVISDNQFVVIAEVESKSIEDKYIYNILCKEIGEQIVSINIYNKLYSAVVVPYITTYDIKVLCVKPRFLNLYTIEKLKKGCPLISQNSQWHIRTTHTEMEIEIDVLDAHQRKLQNISSLTVDWHFIQDDGKTSAQKILFSQKSEIDFIDGVAVPKRDYLRTLINDPQFNFKIKAAVTQYNEIILDHYGIRPEVLHFANEKGLGLVAPAIENELSFLTVEKTLVPFQFISIFLSSNVTDRKGLTQGSGYYNIKANPTGIVEIQFDERTRELVLTPRKIGQTHVSVIDRCLSTDPCIVTVSVVSIGRIEFQSPDRVEKTKSIEAIIKLFDSNDHLIKIDYDNIAIYELSVDVLVSNMLNVQLGNNDNLNEGEIRYFITGVELGETKVVVTSRIENDGNRVSSTPAAIQVFPALSLYPRNITMYVGTSVQIYSKGGPYPDVSIAYFAERNEIASIDSTVVYALKLGHTKVIGRCIGTNPINGSQMVYSEDFLNINVILFDGIKIVTPLVQIKSGNIMPATIWGLPYISPMVLGTLPFLDVYWSTDRPSILEIKGVFDDIGVQYKERNSISMRINALNPGKAHLHVVVVTSNGLKFTASVEINVFRVLELESPKHFVYDPILLPPMAAVQLKANLHDVVYKLDEQQNSTVIKVSKDGFVESMESNGRSLVIASAQDQYFSIPVEVKNIHYILLSLHQSSSRLKHIDKKLPNGFNVVLKITLHDNVGNQFAHDYEDFHMLRHRLSSKDFIDVQFGVNFSLRLKLLQESINILGVALKDHTGIKFPEDYININVGETLMLFPKISEFSAGDIICFDSPLLDSTKWQSLDTKSVVIGSDTGIARVLNTEKNSKVTITHGDSASTYVEYGLIVKALDKIEFLKKEDIFNGERYLGQVVLKNHLEAKKYNNIFGKNLTQCLPQIQTIVATDFFSCHLTVKQSSIDHILDYFRVTPIFDKQVGMYACAIDPVEPRRDLTDLIKSSEVHLCLEVRLLNEIKDKAILKIVPAILITPVIMSVDQLEQKIITITGLDKIIQRVEVRSSHPNELEVTFLSKTQHTTNYRARLLKPYTGDYELSVVVKSPLTTQIVEIPIVASSYIKKCANLPLTSISNLLINSMSSLGFLVTSLVFVGVIAWIFQYCQQSQSNVVKAVFSPFQGDNSQNSSTIHDSIINSSTVSNASTPYIKSSYSIVSAPKSPEDSLVYGDTSLISPHKRTYRRLL